MIRIVKYPKRGQKALDSDQGNYYQIQYLFKMAGIKKSY